MTRLILQDATIIDGENAPRRGTLVVAGDRIESVGAAPIEPRPGDRVVALGGRTVMPGMVLGHYHAAYWKMKAGTPLGLDAPTPLQALRAASNLRLALEGGFTGVIGAGSPNGIDAALKAAIVEGTLTGPHMVACSRDVSATGHSSDMSYPSHWAIGVKGGINIANGADAFRRAVREEAKDGAEIIKLFVTRGHATGGTGHEMEITREEFAAAVGAAHDRGVKVRAHIANRDAILMALDLGIHIVDHGDGFDAECIERSLKQEVYLTPSLLYPKVVIAAMPGTPYTDLMIEPYEQMARDLPAINKAGVKILLGDDYGAMFMDHGRYAEELALYVNEIGIPPLDVIRWATKNGAEAMSLGDQTGTLAPGKLADIVVVDGDPLADITILQDRARLLAVFKCGEAVTDQLGTLETRPADAERAPAFAK
jgi:imidazolonepropionase-like amidohydrolase